MNNPTKYDIKPCPECGSEEFPSTDITKFCSLTAPARTVSLECRVCGYFTNPRYRFEDAVNEWNKASKNKWENS